jgi:hypothetical protein
MASLHGLAGVIRPVVTNVDPVQSTGLSSYAHWYFRHDQLALMSFIK